jgi:hypothetical protein
MSGDSMTANHVEHEIATFTGSPGAGGGSKEKPRRAGAWSYLTIRRSLEGLESLDAPILSHLTQIRQGADRDGAPDRLTENVASLR